MKVIKHNQILIIRISKEINFRTRLKLIIKELIGIPVRELDNGVLEISYSIEHLISNYKHYLLEYLTLGV